MRSIIGLLCVSLAAFALTTTAEAQRVFRASSIDVEQNERLDAVEAKVDQIADSLKSIEQLLSAQAMERVVAQAPRPKPADKESLTTAKPAPTVPSSRTVQTPTSNRYTQAELTAIVQSRYPSGFRVRHADVSPRSAVWSHLKSGIHGFSAEQVDGMPQWIALGLHDMEHGGEITPFRSSASSASTAARPASPAAPPVVASFGVGCANGQCARQITARSVQLRSRGTVRRLLGR